MNIIMKKEEGWEEMDDKIAVFTNSDNLFHVISKSIQDTDFLPMKFRIDQYEEAAGIEFIMGIVDLERTGNTHADFIKIFNIKYHINKPILACIYDEDNRYILDLFTFGIEDYIKKPFRRKEISNKINNIVRYQKWFEKYGVK